MHCRALAWAAAQVPPGPQHDQVAASVAAQAMQQAQHLLDQVFAALKLSLAFAIQHGFIAVLVFCGVIIVATFFLNDVPQYNASADMAPGAGSGGYQNDSSKKEPIIE